MSDKKYYCKSCSAEIVWVKMEKSGSMMPVEVESIKIALILSDDLKKGAIRKTGLSHFSRCPKANHYRNKGV